VTSKARLFTCGRPGRGTLGYGRARKPVGTAIIDEWVKNLPDAPFLHIVSLLGQKTDGFSEFVYYPFRSVQESGTKPTFQEWLDANYERRFVVHEFPTVDAHGIPPDVLHAVTNCMSGLISANGSIVLVDSAGAERTSRVCEAMGYV
jgi:hypothetical protein